MGCVSRNSKEFKTLAEHYKVSVLKLEGIVDKYWRESGSEKNFPSDVYIQYELGKSQYIEPSKIVRELWCKYSLGPSRSVANHTSNNSNFVNNFFAFSLNGENTFKDSFIKNKEWSWNISFVRFLSNM